MPKIAVYGSLRRGQYNHDRFGKMDFLGEATLPGFKMFSLGPYPAVVKTNDETSTIKVELFEVSPNIKQNLDWMEFGAGYEELEVVASVGNQQINASIYAYPRMVSDTIVESGDWVQFKKQQEHVS